MKNRKNTEIRTLIMAAKVVSTLFKPVYYPVLCSMILFTLTPLARLPLQYKIIEMVIMIIFTIAFPMLLTKLFRYMRNINYADMRKRKNRIIPYCIYIVCYLAYLQLMHNANMPYVLLSVIIVAICIQVACTVICLWWKVSVHMAGAGGIIGAIAAYSAIFYYNPLPWLCLAIIIAGLVGTARMILRQHNLSQIVIGTLIGILCGFFGILRGYLLFPA